MYDLTFALLKYTNNDTDTTPTTTTTPNSTIDALMTKHLSSLYMKPLMVLRDRAIDERLYSHYNRTTSTTKNSMLGDYTNLLHILLQSNQTIVGSFASQNIILNDIDTKNNGGGGGGYNDCNLSPSRSIGLSSFAALCTSMMDMFQSSSSSSSSSTCMSSLTKQNLYRNVRVALLENVDELIDCIEFMRPKVKKTGTFSTTSTSTSTSSTTIPTWVQK